MTQLSDAIGQRGESIFVTRITEFDPIRGPIFRPQFLGDKAQFVDHLIFLEKPGLTHLFFLAQVKTTQLGYTMKEQRLKVQVSQNHIQALVDCPAPTYIAGIDARQEKGYIVSANGENLTAMSSLNTSFEISPAHLIQLEQEVLEYWQQGTRPKIASLFQDLHWR